MSATVQDIKDYIDLRRPGTVAEIDDPSGRADSLVTVAMGVYAECALGTDYTRAIALLVLHWFTMEGRGGNSGNIASVKEGQLQISYGKTSSEPGDLGSTSYGAELKTILDRVVSTPIMRNLGGPCSGM